MKRKGNKKLIVPLPAEKRKLPVFKYDVGDIKDGIMDGELLFEYIVMLYKRKSERDFFNATLPLDYLEKVKKQYYHGQNYIYSNHYNRPNINQEYEEYIKSKEWKALRERILSTRYVCENCGASDCELHLHHLTYENFKHEKDEDLQVLCYDCHSKIHKRNVGFKNKHKVVT